MPLKTEEARREVAKLVAAEAPPQEIDRVLAEKHAGQTIKRQSIDGYKKRNKKRMEQIKLFDDAYKKEIAKEARKLWGSNYGKQIEALQAGLEHFIEEAKAGTPLNDKEVNALTNGIRTLAFITEKLLAFCGAGPQESQSQPGPIQINIILEALDGPKLATLRDELQTKVNDMEADIESDEGYSGT